MRVTGVIPVHNHTQWVADAFFSMARQTYRPLRIVVVDDGSTDGSIGQVLRHLSGVKFEEKAGAAVGTGRLEAFGLDVLCIRFGEARGPAFARNTGIRAGWHDTDAFALLDSDDLYAPQKVELSVAKITAAPSQVGVVYSDYDTLNEDGLRVRQYKLPYSKDLLMQECIVNCDSIVSKAAIETVGLMDETLRVCEDYDWWVRLSEHYMFAHLPLPLLTVRVGTHSSTDKVKKDLWNRCYARVFEKARERARA